MKLKIRAEAKDWILFLLFSLALLFMVAIVVVNLSSFAATGEFVGLNPIPAFTEYLLATIVIFIFVMSFIFINVSSYFFEFEKGIGIGIGSKKQEGYSKWTTEKEMKKELAKVLPIQEKSESAGIPIINNGKEIWVDNGEFHNLIIGSTGSGKTEMLVQPMVKILAKAGESMIITDPKGEIYEKNANELREKGYNVVLLNFRNPQSGNSWNPLTLPYQLHKEGNKDKANELLDDLAANILYDEKAQNQDPFWEKTSADYFTGLALALFDDAKEEEINLNSINLMTTVGEDKCGHSTYMKEYFSFKSQASPAFINVSSTLMAPNETKSSILSVFKQKIKLFSSRENLSEMLSHSDFDMKDIGKKKTAVFIVVQDEKKTYHSLVTIFIKQCYETLIDVAQESGGKLPFRTNFILDEFANMPPLKDVTTMVTAARSRRIRFSFIIQNFAQLYQVYGKENGETIKGNCGNIIYLISSELSALEEISKMCGEKKSKEKDKTASTPLITVSDLQRLPKWSVVILRLRKYPFKTKLTPNWQLEKDRAWGRSYPLATYPTHEKKEIELFDIKKFVDSKKEQKLNEIMGNISGNQGGFNPFQEKPMPKDNFNINEFMKNESPKKDPLAGINIDEFLKNIDAKIAELEEEERKEKASKQVKTNVEQETPKEPLELPKDVVLKEPSDPSELKNGVSDDQFFDDFFNDEEN